MSRRRPLLLLGALGLAATAPRRVQASTDVEAAGYGGTTAGGWVCGPVGRANYAGVGARVRVAEEPARFGGKGFTGEVAGAAEREETTIVSCNESATCPDGTRLNPMYGGHVRAGYQWETVGLQVGATAFQGYGHPRDETGKTAVLPDAEVSYGAANVVRGVLGLGSPTVTTLRRPGLYLGVDLPVGKVDVEARAGAFRAGPALTDASDARADVAVYVPLSEPVSLRFSGSVGGNSDGLGAEGSAGIRGSL